MPRPTTLPEPWQTLAARVGGVQALADRFCVVPSSVYYWSRQQRGMSRMAKMVLQQLLKELDIKDTAWESWL